MMTDTPPPTTADSTASMASPSPASSKSPTPPPTKAGPSKKKKKAPLPVQLIGDLPIARAEALSTFTEMKLNWYQSQRMGLSRETMESMNCDCTFKPGRDEPYIACGHNSDCINRLTQVECLAGECRCKEFCQNQRFQNREYANIDIVKTEKKGFGLRAEGDIERDTFIYEYIGDVVDDKKFRRRMREYADEGIKHFYFMMLQKDEFIDATKNGGIGRFANHSCNPNCYVGKWTIGDRVRMGIFAKRNIKQYEELTFDYNVDRYGHDAQVCHCGEPQCVGFIGGKTQTLSDDMLEALGVDEDDVGEYKASKKRRGKKLDDPDFMPMRYIKVNEVPKVIQALRQNSSPKMVYKLLTRIKITEDPSILRQIMRLRGLTLMKNILEDNSDNIELTTLALECLITWPLTQRNKIEDSQIETELDKRLESTDDTVKELSTKLKAQWETLAVGYRIPKRSAEGELEKTDSLWDVVEFGSKASPPPESNFKRLRLTPPSLPSHTLDR
ncbi:hypothetical protein CPB85DRAFT_914875 [Mucidula mucida]|nr:hypothetical protein CPB85DRAFT_914875 [Mucidula mucida]